MLWCMSFSPRCYNFSIQKWASLSNSELKRLFESGSVKIWKEAAIIPANLKTLMTELEYGDHLIFGRVKDIIGRIMIEVMTEAKPPENTTIYRWLVDNKEEFIKSWFTE
jgi:hypothetical protein